MYKGTEASAGIGIGKAVLVRSAEPVIRRELAADADAEVERLRKALAYTAVRTEKLASELASRTGEKEAGILQAHLMLLSEPTLIGEIESFIRKEANTPWRRSAVPMPACFRPWTTSGCGRGPRM